MSSDRELRQRAWYYTHLAADPQDANTVYVLNVMFWRSIDGGTSFRPIRVPHGDNHALWINPDDPQNLIEGNDGGANISFNGGRSWSTQENQPTSEIYRVTVDDQYPYWLYGGQQDNSAVAIPSRSPGGIAWRDWYAPAGCESATVAVDPRNPNITYGGCYGGSIGRYDHELEQEQEIMAWPQMAVGQQAQDLRYRFQWNSPIRISPHDPTVLYHCANVVLRSTDEGRSWEEISPDLTRNDRVQAGLRRRADHDGQHRGRGLRHHLRLRGIAAPGRSAVGGERRRRRLHLGGQRRYLAQHHPGRACRSGGRSTRSSCPPTIPVVRSSPSIAIARTTSGPTSSAPMTTAPAGPGSPTARTASPADHFVRVVREDPDRKGLLYAGTEFGIYVSFDDGANWKPLPAQSAGHPDHRYGGQAWRSRDLHPGAVVLDPG